MSQSLSDDEKSRAGALVSYADVQVPYQDKALAAGSLWFLWPTSAIPAGADIAPQQPAASSDAAPTPLTDVSAAAAAPAVQPDTGTSAAPANGSVPGPANAVAIASVTDVLGPVQTPMNGGAPAAPVLTATSYALNAVPVAATVGGLFMTSSAMVMPGADIPVATFTATTFDLGAFAGDLEGQLGQLEQVLVNNVFTQSLPLLGTALSDAFGQGIAALQSIQALQTSITTALNNLLNSGPATAQQVQDAINGALQSNGFNAGATVSYNSGTGTLTFGMNEQGTDSVPIPLAKDFGIPNLKLTSVGTNTVNVGLNYGLDFNATLNAQGGFAVTEPNGPALKLGVDVTVPNFNETADLGILQVTATNPRNDTFLNGNFSIDTNGSATFTGAAQLDTHVATDIAGATIPTVSADLIAGWSFGASNVGADVTAFGSVPSVAIDNITFDLGPLVDNFLRPILDTLAPVLKPLQDVLNLFNYDLTPIFQAALGDGWHALDVAGSLGPGLTDQSDDKITLIDLLRLSTGFQTGGLITLIEAVNSLISFASFLDTAINTATTPFSLGNYSLTQDIRSTSFDISQAVPVNTKTGGDLTSALAGLVGGDGSQSLPQVATALIDGPDFSVPILNDGIKAFQFLFGGAQDIFDANLPIPAFHFGTIDAAGAPINPQDFIPPIPTDIPLVDLTLSGALQAVAGLNVGFDTSGLAQYAQSDFKDASLIQNGLFIADPVVDGVEQPILSLGAAVELGVELNGLIASIGGGGDVSGQLAISLAQPGKNYLDQLETKIGQDPLSIFSATGRVTAGLDAVVKVLGQTVDNFNSPRLPVYSFNIPGGSGLPSKTTWNGAADDDFENMANWTPAFGLTSTSFGSTDYYGDATIALPDPGAGKAWIASLTEGVAAELTSITVGVGNRVEVGPGLLLIDGTTIDSANAGQIAIDDTGNMILQGNLNNTGSVYLGLFPAAENPNESPTLTVSGLVNLYGGGTVLLSDSSTNMIAAAGPSAYLINTDNLISGEGTIAVPLLNEGHIVASPSAKQNFLVLNGSISNSGTLEANDGNLDATESGLKIGGNVDNTGGTIQADAFSIVLLENGVTIIGGLIKAGTESSAGRVEADGAATLDGSKSPIEVEGDVEAGANNTLTVTGLITSTPAAQITILNAGIRTQGGTVVLDNATIRNGLLVGTSNKGSDLLEVSGTTTLSGTAGDNALDIDGVLHVANGNTVVMDGTVAGLETGSGIELAGGTMVIGDASSDAATFGTFDAGTALDVKLDDGTGGVITGKDSAAVLSNAGTIEGSGTVGNDQLVIINETGARIIANGSGTLLVDSFQPILNAGWVGAAGGTLDLQVSVLNANGTLAADGGVLELDDSTIGGGLLESSSTGSIAVITTALLDGTAGAVTLTADSQLGVAAGTVLTLAGTIANGGTISIQGNAASSTPTATAIVKGDVTLNGGGRIELSDASGGLDSTVAVIQGANEGGDLFNVDNTITGYGLLGADSLGLTNESAGLFQAATGTLLVHGGAGLTNAGTLSAVTGGTLLVEDSVLNTGGTIDANGGTVDLANITVFGGTLASDTSGVVDFTGNSTLEGNPGVTIAANSSVAVVPAATLTLAGTLVDRGVLSATGDASAANDSQIVLQNKVVLTGGGTIALTYLPGGGQIDPTLLAGGTLDNVSGTISGSGGVLLQALTNEAGGVIAGVTTFGDLDIDAFSTIENLGLIRGDSGGLSLDTPVNNPGLITTNGGIVRINATVTNSGSIVASSGEVSINAGVTNTGLVEAAGNGLLFLSGTTSVISGKNSDVRVLDIGRMEIEGGTISGGTLNIAPGGTVEVRSSSAPAVFTGVAVTNNGVLEVAGNSAGSPTATLRLDSSITLAGTGTVSMDGGDSTTQVITGGAAADTLDNVGNTIIGQGQIGAGTMTLLNEAKGLIVATGGTLVVDTGANTITNLGTLAARSGTLELRGTVDNSQGSIVGSVVHVNDPNSFILLDGATVQGGWLIADGLSAVEVTGNGGTLDGTASKIQVSARVLIDGVAGLTLTGAIVNFATIQPEGGSDPADPDSELRIRGTATLSGGGKVIMGFPGISPRPVDQEIIGGKATDTLINVDNTISGAGLLGNGTLTLDNQTKGTIAAIDGTLVVDTGANAVINAGQMQALGGTLLLRDVIDSSSGGTVAALQDATKVSGEIILDGGTIRGGTLKADPVDQSSVISLTANGGTLDGGAGTLTVTAGSQIDVQPGRTLTITGPIATSATINVTGNWPSSAAGRIRVIGTASLSGGGLITLADNSGYQQSTTQLITGDAATDKLENVDNTIIGYGTIGGGTMALRNETHGTIEATVSTIDLNTGTNTVVNAGLLEAFGGTLVLHNIIDGTAGGTIAALDNGGGAEVVLDGATIKGGSVVTDLIDPASAVYLTAKGGALDGTAGAVTIAAGAHVYDRAQQTLTLSGAIVNKGTLGIGGFNGDTPAEVAIGGTVTLTGGGVVSITDLSGYNTTAAQLVEGTAASATLDNVDNLIVGYGSLGGGTLTLRNEVKGTIEATVGTLDVDGGGIAAVNDGLLEAINGTLLLHNVVDNTGGGTIAALNNGAGGTVTLDGATLIGGTIRTDLVDPFSGVYLTTNGGTLDGTAGAVTIAAGAHAYVRNHQTLTLHGGIVNAGTVDVGGFNGAAVAAAVIGGTVTLSGGGLVTIEDVSGYNTTASEAITGTKTSDTLDNIDNTIRGFGSLGAGTLTFSNESKATVDAVVGTLVVDTGANTIVNKGLMEAVGGTLQLNSGIANSGTIEAGAAGAVTIAASVANTALVEAESGGTVTVQSSITGNASTVTVLDGGGLVLDGGALSGGTLSIAKNGNARVTTNDATLTNLAILNAGTFAIVGQNGAGTAVATIAGTVTLSGGGTVSLFDVTGYNQAITQTIVGTSAAATLDNLDNTISGYGYLGAGALTLRNETKGTIEATIGTLDIDTGGNVVLNDGVMGAAGGTLVLQSHIDNTAGGTIAALNKNGAGGNVTLDGATLKGGIIRSDLADPVSGVYLTAKGGTLDGTGGAITIAAGAHVYVRAGQTLTARGAIINEGTLDIGGLNGDKTAALSIGGTVTLSGGGLVTIEDLTGYNTAPPEEITGTTAADTLDNVDNTIRGFGVLGGGTLAFSNDAKGTVDAVVGTLTVDTGANTVVNKGLMEAVGGTLQLNSGIANSGTIEAGTAGAVTIAASIANTALVEAASGGTVTVQSSITGNSSTVTVLDGGGLVLDGGTLAGGTLSIAQNGNARITIKGATLANLAIVNAGSLAVIGQTGVGAAVATIGGTVTLSGGGAVSLSDVSGYQQAINQTIVGTSAAATLDNLDNTISGYGFLGAGTLGLTNEALGTIEATISTLTIDTGANTAINAGLLEAVGGTLTLASAVTNSGTIEAGAAGVIAIDRAVANTGLIKADANGTVAVTAAVTGGDETVAAGGTLTLDGGGLSNGTLTIAATGAAEVTTNGATLANLAIVNAGTFAIIGRTGIGSAVATIGGTVTLSGGGAVSLFDSSGYQQSIIQTIIGTSAAAKLVNTDNLISGYGALGAGTLALSNGAQGTIEALIGTLTVDTGANTVTNAGLLSSMGGTLVLDSGVANSGTIEAETAGFVTIGGAITNTSLIKADSGGVVTVRAAVTGGGETAAAGGTLALDGGALSNGSLSIAATGTAEVTIQGGTLAAMTIVNDGSFDVIGQTGVGTAVATIGGTVTLSGGGTVSLFDASGYQQAVTQIVVGASAAATLVNTDNLITGYGALGGGELALVNQAKGTIQATIGSLTIDGGATAVANQGLIEASAGTLILRGTVDGTKGGTVAAVASGVVVLDGGTLLGGTVQTDPNDASTMLTVSTNGGTLDGTAGAVTIAAGAHVVVTQGDTLLLKGAIDDLGTIAIAGLNGLGVTTARIGGDVTIDGGGLIAIADVSGYQQTTPEAIEGISPSDKLDNRQGTILGFGQLGAGTLTLVNEAQGTIESSIGTLAVDTGGNAVTNLGIMEATPNSTLDLRSVVTGGGTIMAAGGTVVLDGITVQGGVLDGTFDGPILVNGGVALDGRAGAVTLAAGADVIVGASDALTLAGSVTNDGTIANDGTVNGALVLGGAGALLNAADGTVNGAVTASAAGETVSNLGTIAGAVSLAGGDRLVVGQGAVFGGGITGGKGGNTLEVASGSFALTGFNAPGSPQYSTLQIDAGVSVSADQSDLLGGVTLVNNGVLDLTAFEATAPLQNDGDIVGDVTLAAGVPVVNMAGGFIAGSGLAVIESPFGPASVTNAGVIDPAQYGVDLSVGGTVVNQAGGTIEGTVAGVLISGGAGTVTNGGTIIGDGGVAVTLAAGFANRVILAPGASFSGTVDGGNPVGGAIASVLEVAGDAGFTTLSGLGTKFINFSTVLVDPVASVSLTGQNTLVAGVTLQNAGSLAVNGGAGLTEASSADVSGATGSAGAVTVSGAGSSWTLGDGLVVGDKAGGGVTVNASASISVAATVSPVALVLGAAAGGNGAFTVTGAGSSATLTGQSNVGQSGTGTLTVANKGTVTSGGKGSAGIDAGAAAGSAGNILVTGTQSLLTNTGEFIVGDAGVGHLSVNAGGTLITSPGTSVGLAGLVIGNTSGADGSSADFSGAGSQIDVTGLLDVGVSGSGALSVSNGASVTAGSLDAGNIDSAVANISVTDADFTVTGNATVADDGTGVLSVLAGATFAAANLTIGSQGDSSGAVVVSGTGSVINIAGNLNVGTSLGTGDLTIGPGGVVNAKVVSLQGQVVLENGELDPTVNLINQGQTAGGSGTIAAGDIVDEGVIQAGGSKPSQKLLVVNGTILGGGPWTINGTAQAQANGGAGILQINAGGTLELNGAVLNAPSTTFTDDVTPQGTYTVNNSVIDVNFADATGVLKIDQIAGFAGTIAAFQKGDSFVVTGGTLSGLGVSNGNTLTVSDSGHGGTDSLIFASGVSAAGFSIVNNNTIQVACFAAGTRISVENGCVPVEDLRAGDLLVTADGRVEPIVWIGQRTVNCRAHPRPETVWPVLVSAGAFGNGPARDLYLSPDHAVYVNDVLIPVKLLINGTSIAQVKRSTVTYYHVELPRHDVILAEGLTVESYLDLGDRANFNDGATIRLFPDFATRFGSETAAAWETKGAAPLVLAGGTLASARRVVAAHAHRRRRRSGRKIVSG